MSPYRRAGEAGMLSAPTAEATTAAAMRPASTALLLLAALAALPGCSTARLPPPEDLAGVPGYYASGRRGAVYYDVAIYLDADNRGAVVMDGGCEGPPRILPQTVVRSEGYISFQAMGCRDPRYAGIEVTQAELADGKILGAELYLLRRRDSVLERGPSMTLSP